MDSPSHREGDHGDKWASLKTSTQVGEATLALLAISYQNIIHFSKVHVIQRNICPNNPKTTMISFFHAKETKFYYTRIPSQLTFEDAKKFGLNILFPIMLP